MTRADLIQSGTPSSMASAPFASDDDAAAIAKCRELLGAEAEDLSDSVVVHISRHADVMARVLVEMFLAKAA